MPDRDPTVRQELQNALTRLTFATAILFAALMIVVVYVYIDSNNKSARATRAEAALCALRDDTQNRIKQSQDYLNQHPHGAPGIPVAAIKQGITNSQRTIAALGDLRCPVPTN